MNQRVLTALSHDWEAGLVATVERSAGYTVVRRCADLADLLAAAAAGLADVAIVSADLRALDRSALRHLAAHGVRTAGAVGDGDEAAERRLRQLGLEVVLRAEGDTAETEQALAALAPPTGSRGPGPGPGPGSGTVAVAPWTWSPTPAAGNGRDEGDAEDSVGAEDSGNEDDEAPGSTGWAAVEGSTVLAVWGPTGAPGRSTVALNLAAELAGTARTLLVDCDTYGSSIAQALSLLDEAPGMAAAARAADLGSLDLAALARLAPEVSPGLRVLTGIPRADRWPELRAAAVEHVLTVARRLAEFVVVDCGFAIEDDEELSYDTVAPRRNAATLTVLEVADELVVVGAADPVGLQRLVRAVQDVGSVPSPPPRVVVNKVRASAVGARPERRIAEALERFAGLQQLAFLPWDPQTLDGAMFAGRTLREAAPQSELRRALVALAGEYAAVPEPSSARRRRR